MGIRSGPPKPISVDFKENPEQIIWDSWLDEKFGEKLNAIRTVAKTIYIEKQEYNYPYFLAQFGTDHCRAIEDLIHRIIPGMHYQKLSMSERYFLLSSAWLHDIGMQPHVAEIVSGGIVSDEEILSKSHIITEKYIIENLNIDESEKQIIARLCRYPTREENLSNCEEVIIFNGEKIRLRLLASYLRLAHSLYIGHIHTPADYYSIFFIYDIPYEKKMDWIKSKFVYGIYIDETKHLINLHFLRPEGLENKCGVDNIIGKYSLIINLILDSYRDDLNSVINILIRAGVTYFLDVNAQYTNARVDGKSLNNIKNIVINFDILTSPSASLLLEGVIVASASLLGFNVYKGKPPIRFSDTEDVEKLISKEKMFDFFDAIHNTIQLNRPCNLAVKSFISKCKKTITTDFSVTSLIDVINNQYQKHHLAKSNIRETAQDFFRKHTPQKQNHYNILLFGYSELVCKAINGLRDFLIKNEFSSIDPKTIYGSKLETLFSEKISLFICEGQPKTKTYSNDKLLYHDGSQYALHLEEKGFSNIIIIPDAISGTIIDLIDFIFIGTNGINSKEILTSAGHKTIISIAKCASKPVVLVTTKEKFVEEESETKLSSTEQIQEISGCYFYSAPNISENRKHPWMTRDNILLENLHQKKILFMNPREEVIPINNIDYIVTDEGYQKISTNKTFLDLFKTNE